jgi:hypothetical protein
MTPIACNNLLSFLEAILTVLHLFGNGAVLILLVLIANAMFSRFMRSLED